LIDHLIKYSLKIFNGELIHPNIQLFSAYNNPCRLYAKTQSTTKVKNYEEQSSLVYQVNPLPDQILDYV